MELQQWKQNFIRDYLDEIDSLEVMDKLEKYTKRILNKKPVALSPIYTMRKRSHDTSRFIMGLPSEPRQAQKTIRQI